MSFTVLPQQPNVAQNLSSLSGSLLGGYLNQLQQTQQKSEEHSKLSAALTQAENMPGLSNEQKQTISLYKALSERPELAQALSGQFTEQSKVQEQKRAN